MRLARNVLSELHRIYCCIEQRCCDECGQATVEAAALLPTLMLLIGMLVQPVCLAYTRSVMCSAAAEAARAMLSASDRTDEVRAFVLRRLAAIPEVPLFHVGGDDDWDIALETSGHEVSVRLTGHARPLPLVGLLASSFSESDGDGIVLRTELVSRVRPEWLGGDYDAWIGMWG